MRLAIFVDGPYRRVGHDHDAIAADPADHPFLTFADAVGRHFDSRCYFTRVADGAGDPRFRLPAGAGVVPLPDFGDLRQIGRVAAAGPRTLVAFWRGLSSVDAVWVFGPHPFGCLLAVAATVRGKHVVLGVRQDTAEYFRSRTLGNRRSPAQLAARAVATCFHLLARRAPTTAVGQQIAADYAGAGRRVHAMTVTLMRAADVSETPPDHSWDAGPIQLLTVGRVDREKNPLLLIEALAELDRTQPGRHRLTWVGTGPMRDEVAAHARRLGIGELVDLPGFVPFGVELVAHYRRAHAFVHVALTEGVPAVLMEALATGVPLIATDVGGVRAALADGAVGLLIPPNDRDALIAAIRALTDDAAGRDRRARQGLALARECTLEREAARAAEFISRSHRPRRRGG